MNKKLLIDAHQPEETRVVLLNDQKIEEFDYENTARKQLKGNVYLARVTRVEPSLQAAFVNMEAIVRDFLLSVKFIQIIIEYLSKIERR